MNFEQLRATYQCPEQMARVLFAQVELLEIELAAASTSLSVAEALRSLEQALRIRAEKKLAAATATAPRRTYRQDEEE